VAGLVRVQLRQARKTSRVIVIAETSAAAARPDALCDPDTVDAILFGADDMCADLGAEPHAAVVDHARNSVLLQAAATRIPVIDSPFFDLADDAGLSAAATAAAAQGFAGKAAIHPKQIGAINSAFTPTTAQIDWAQKVLAANDAGAGTVAGEMVDEAVARRARRILTLTHP
jgi:(S)-citramalyl-CoA lyase